jgi:CheY-like chemotaxis protein
MSKIMNNLLDLRKIEEGKMELTVAPFSLDAVLNNMTKMLMPTVRKDVQFISKCNTGKRDMVIGDSHRIQQVLNNVVSNAIKYTMIGSVVVELGWEDDNVRFACTDMGPGIPIKEQERLFQRFVQRGGAPGTGLGLAIAKHLVDLMDGSIRFVSDPTVKPGTCCVVTFPLSPFEPPNGASLTETNTEQPYSVLEGPLSFLIIDDVKINRSMLGRRIKRCIAPNAIITEAASGEDALTICAKESFDVIVVDQYMEEAGGVMVGTDVVFAMRRMRINSVIIGCSGNDMNQLFTQAGCDWVWGKPLPSNAVVATQVRIALLNRNLLKEEN